MSKLIKVAVIGECMAELSGQVLGNMKQGYGGDTLNTALYLKRLLDGQAVVSYVTAMGDDSLSSAIVEQWQAAGIDTQYVLRDSQRNVGLYMIENDDQGERTFHYWRDSAAARFIVQHLEFKRVTEALFDYDVIYVSGISFAILPDNDRAQLLTMLDEARFRGVKLVFDGNYRPRLWQSVAQTKENYEQFYEQADLALLTFDDEADLWGDASIAAAAERLAMYTIPRLVLKDGANGCYLVAAGNMNHVATTPVANVVDTTAAGDSFNAGFLAAWLLGKTDEQAADWGNQLAGQVIQQAGAIVPTQPLIER
ncbi:sugar kinase [Neiella litorisoli]|uniref:sugar kinase n=1 Tax=Neiella litorisoli TaxID=2771431 RepID=UPI0034E28A32